MKKSRREYALERAEFLEKEKKRKNEEGGQENAIFHVPVLGKNGGKFGNYALCSPEDFELLIQYCWAWDSGGYAVTNHVVNGKTKGLRMARLISNPPDGLVVDHIDGNRGNNTRENLRNITKQQNTQNKSKSRSSKIEFFGVVKFGTKFVATVSHTGKSIALGTYKTSVEAAIVYDRYIAQNRDQFYQKLNFPEKEAEYLASSKVEPKIQSNKHGFKGVSKELGKNTYRARIKLNKKMVKIGSYSSITEAAKAYDTAIVKYQLNRSFNFPVDHSGYCPPKSVKTQMIEISDDPIILEIIKAIGVDPKTLSNDDILVEIYPERRIYSLIERQDYPIVQGFKLCLSQTGYATLSQTGNALSRFLMKCEDENLVVDHIFSNRLDNRKRMLKITTVAGNMRNTKKRKNTSSSYKNVSWDVTNKNWRIRIIHDGVRVYSKNFKDCLEAARQRDLYCITKYPGEYRLNFTDWVEPGVIDHWRTTLGLSATWPNEEEKK